MRQLTPLLATVLFASTAAAGVSETEAERSPAAPAASAPMPAVSPEPMPALSPDQTASGYTKYGTPLHSPYNGAAGSTYIPVDSWIYPAMMRLYSLGYADSMFLNMRPWTRRSVLHMLQASEGDILDSDNTEAQSILASLMKELEAEVPDDRQPRGAVFGLYSGYTRLMGITGTPLRDSYHLGQTIVNDYGRPYQEGFNNVTGFESVNEAGRFSLHVRGEYQHAPSAAGYSTGLASFLSTKDGIPYTGFNVPQDTIPAGPIASQNTFALQEATVSFHLGGHEISGGKSDAWVGPTVGGSEAWSNNAQDIYSFRVNRVEPLFIPLVSKLLGPVRYDFFYGSLKGHTYPNSPWTHSEMFSFAPTSNFQFGFQRTIVFGGKGHQPVTLHTFLKGFFDINDTTEAEKFSRDDPGARFSDFNFSWRLPFVRHYATLYLDSITHDDVTPISAPRRASFRTGLYLSQIPHLRRWDLRGEGVMNDQPVQRSVGGFFNYYEVVQRQAYTNKGFIMGDWVGREGKGGQAWLTYHMSPDEWVQVEYLHKKTAKDFIAFGTTQTQFRAEVRKRLRPDVALNAWVQYERWNAPLYKPGAQNDTTITTELIFYPHLHRISGAQ